MSEEPVAWRCKGAMDKRWWVTSYPLTQEEIDRQNLVVQPLFIASSNTLIEEQAARIEELEQKLRTTSLEALAISDTNNELQARIYELEGAYDNMSSLCARVSQGRSDAKARLSEAVKVLEEAAMYLDGFPEYHDSGMGCGLEDRNITDRYEAMRHGWDSAMDRTYIEHVNPASEAIKAFITTLGGEK